MTEDQRIAIPADEVFASFSPARKAQIAVRAAELIAEHNALRDIRKSRKISQEELARQLCGKQAYVSRLEKRTDVKLSTLREYIKGLGGELQLLVTFPEGQKMSIKDFGSRPTKERPVKTAA